MKLGLQLRKSVLLISAGLMLTGCASNETAGELVATTTPISADTQKGELDRDAELLALMREVDLDPCPAEVPNPDAAIPGLPDQDFDCLGDTSVISLAQVRGMPMIVNVWASWCPPCIEELPLLAQASRDLKGRADFIGINIEDDPTKALQLMQDFDISYPSVYDRAGDTRAPLNIPGPPVTYFVSPEGVIMGRWDGSIPNDQTFDALLLQYLGITR